MPDADLPNLAAESRKFLLLAEALLEPMDTGTPDTQGGSFFEGQMGQDRQQESLGGPQLADVGRLRQGRTWLQVWDRCEVVWTSFH